MSKSNEEKRKVSVENNQKIKKTNDLQETQKEVGTKTGIEINYLSYEDEKLH